MYNLHKSAMHNFDILGVEAFVAVADLGSFSQAADRLHLSQTALSRRIVKLEAAVGGKLLARTTRSVSLTQPGADFLPRARRLVREMSAALAELKESTMHGYGHVVMGCLPTVAAGRMSRVIALYGERYPRNRIQILDRSATEIRQAVLRGEAEFGISVLPARHNELDCVTLFRDPVVMVCPRHHPLAKRKRLAWRSLAGQPLIGIGSLSGLRLQTEAVISENKLSLWFAYEVQHLATAVGLVAGGAGIAILPLGACDVIGRTGLCVVPLVKPTVCRAIELFHRRGHVFGPAAQPLYDLVLEQLGG
ncbi:MAG: LysR family transcriptional regulator [Candidimonas sp.]